MNLYIVVRHRQDPKQKWANSWLDDERLESITTSPEIGWMCNIAKEKGERVFVHRCGWGKVQPVVCCSAIVLQSDKTNDQTTWFVTFGEQQVLDTPTPIKPSPGQSFYMQPDASSQGLA